MKTLPGKVAVLATLLLAPVSHAQQLPGTPLAGGSFGTINITDGLTLFPGLVQPGDVILRETPTGGNGLSNGSDAVRFFNFAGFGAAFQIPDGEAGIPSLLVGDGFGNTILPDALSSNTLFMDELQFGAGNDTLDVTPFSVPGAAYDIHSDAAGPSDVSDVILQPGAVTIPKGNYIITLPENPGTDFFQTTLPSPVVPGMNAPLDGGDTVTYTELVGGRTRITLNSVADDTDSTRADDSETFTAMGDETVTSYFIDSADVSPAVPEPSTLASLVLGGLCLAGLILRRCQKRGAG